MNSEKEYLVGKYDLEMLTMPRLYFENVEIKQSKITKLPFHYLDLFKFQKGMVRLHYF